MRRIDNEEGLSPLSQGEIQCFCESGYLIYPEFFVDWNCNGLRRALNRLTSCSPNSKSIVPHPVFNELIAHPAVLTIVRSILGYDFLFHHANGRMLSAGDEGKPWHHDYDGERAEAPDKYRMIHLMGYPGGLCIDAAPLVLLPKSHHSLVDRTYPRRFGLQHFEGEINVVGEQGLLVVIDSALWHARRKNYAQEPRVYFNYSYCQAGKSRPERAKYSAMLQSLRGLPGDWTSTLMRPEKR